MKQLFASLTCMLLCLAMAEVHAQSALASEAGPYFGVTPTDTPQLLAPSLLATPLDEYNGVFSKEGDGFVFTTNAPSGGIISFTSMDEDGSWASVRVAPFSGTYSEYDPLLSPDGKYIYFSSERPLPGEDKGGQTHIWYVPAEGRTPVPTHVPLTSHGDYYSSLTRDGTIYFNTWSTGDIRRAMPSDTGYILETLPEQINNMSDVGDPFIAADESYLIFRGYGGQNFGRGDLYISYYEDGVWSIPQNVGKPINSEAHEMCPAVTMDGKMFVFASNRLDSNYSVKPLDFISSVADKYTSPDNGNLNLYFTSTDFVETLRQTAVFR